MRDHGGGCQGAEEGEAMIETDDLILDKAVFDDWKGMYRNVWSQQESARYMAWRVTESESDARIRIRKTIDFQKNHDTYVVYEKKSGEPVGFAGVEELAPRIFQEAGICLGPKYVGKGFGKQILAGLIAYCQREFGAEEFIFSAREENAAANGLARSLGFKRISSEAKVDGRDGHGYNLVRYGLKL